MSEQVDQIGGNLEEVRKRIGEACARAGRNEDDVQLISVVKKRPLESVRRLFDLGERHFAENRVQEMRDRIPQMPDGIAWHFVGHLQTNKAKYLPGLVSWVHSVEKADIGEALNKAWDRHPDLPPLNILLQFNISGEEQKHGASEEDAMRLLERAVELPRLKLQGLMCMAPYDAEADEIRRVFSGLRELRDRLQTRSGILLPHLSMGMTNDYELAIAEGSTMVRIGTALFE